MNCTKLPVDAEFCLVPFVSAKCPRSRENPLPEQALGAEAAAAGHLKLGRGQALVSDAVLLDRFADWFLSPVPNAPLTGLCCNVTLCSLLLPSLDLPLFPPPMLLVDHPLPFRLITLPPAGQNSNRQNASGGREGARNKPATCYLSP